MRQLPVHGGPRGLDGPADARLGRADPRRGRAARSRRASAARSACARAPTRTTRWATGATPRRREETFGGDWFHSKDAATQDEDGYVWYAGRADDVIIAAGYRIGPFEVESACLEHPAVREAAAVASPDEVKRQRRQGVHRPRRGPRAVATSSPRRSSASSATASAPTPIRAGSSSSTTCPRRSPARSAGSSCASASASAREGEVGSS